MIARLAGRGEGEELLNRCRLGCTDWSPLFPLVLLRSALPKGTGPQTLATTGGELFRAPYLDGHGNRERWSRKISRGQILPIRRPGKPI